MKKGSPRTSYVAGEGKSGGAPSMQNDTQFAKRVAQILRVLSEKIEKNPSILEDLGFEFKDNNLDKIEEILTESTPDLDIITIFLQDGPLRLREKLRNLDRETLMKILDHHNYDPSHFARKWSDAERIIDLIMKRVSSQVERHKPLK